jgi:uncharacterized membrane protein YebE (DUF533 family)
LQEVEPRQGGGVREGAAQSHPRDDLGRQGRRALDNAEMTKIQQAITGHDLDGAAKSFLFDALSVASDAASVAKLAENEQQACEISVASRLVIGGTPGERRYMEQLAAGLNLPGSLTSRLDTEARSAAS